MSFFSHRVQALHQIRCVNHCPMAFGEYRSFLGIPCLGECIMLPFFFRGCSTSYGWSMCMRMYIVIMSNTATGPPLEWWSKVDPANCIFLPPSYFLSLLPPSCFLRPPLQITMTHNDKHTSAHIHMHPSISFLFLLHCGCCCSRSVLMLVNH